MKAETWMARCAAELQHLHLISLRGEGVAQRDDWSLATAGELIAAQRYRGLDPVQAARVFYRQRHAQSRHHAGSPALRLR